jgi:hypothetical protein
MAAEWVSRTLAAPFDITRMDTIHGDIAVSRADASMLEPAHH